MASAAGKRRRGKKDPKSSGSIPNSTWSLLRGTSPIRILPTGNVSAKVCTRRDCSKNKNHRREAQRRSPPFVRGRHRDPLWPGKAMWMIQKYTSGSTHLGRVLILLQLGSHDRRLTWN